MGHEGDGGTSCKLVGSLQSPQKWYKVWKTWKLEDQWRPPKISIIKTG